MDPRVDAGGAEQLRQAAIRATGEAARRRALEAWALGAPDDPRAHYELGRHLARTGHHDTEALEALNKALALDPHLAEARLAVGVIHHRQGAHDLAERMYRVALERNPKLHKARANLAALAAERGQHARALEGYDELLRLAPNSVSARRGRGEALYALGRVREAIAAWEAALAINPADAASLGRLAEVLQAAHDPRAGQIYARSLAVRPQSTRRRLALARWLAGNGDPEQAATVLREGLAQAPDSLPLWEAFARLLQEEGRPEEAVADLRGALAEGGGDSRLRLALARLLSSMEQYEEAGRELRPILMAEPRNEEARCLAAVLYACVGDVQEASAAALAALRLDPSRPWPRLLLVAVPNRPTGPLPELTARTASLLPTERAYALALRGLLQLAFDDGPAAARLFGQAVEEAPEAALPRVARGVAHMIESQREPAHAELRTASLLQPADPNIQHLAGEAAFHAGRYDEALESFHAALLIGDADPSLRAYTFFCRARAFRKLGRTQEALQCYQEAQSLDAQYVPAWYGAAVALQEMGRCDRALVHYRRCTELSPGHARAFTGMGNCLERLGQAPEAVEAYRSAVQADPRYAPPHYNLAVLLERRGAPEEVAGLLRAYLRLAPKSANAGDARRRLVLADLRASGVTVGSHEPAAEEEVPFFDTSEEGDDLVSVTPRGPVDPGLRTR